ncbi:Protein diaphanous like 2 [Dissostichus eleginoides]|uniref:Protein diaphanous like 2 n=1 Tax=Dissostichus eleginoides TaxID=100907 RepID=A0AAD9FFI0_DISEL|nr:Protein diaphanous like 2 [Dissostichus eleginoides]
MDQASGGEDPNKPSKKKSNEDEGKNKKLNIHIKTLADDMRDRITSFRKTGNKKEKPLIQHSTQHSTDPLFTQVEMPVPQPLFDDRSMNLSEKEINDLFEKMMEDMNLNEERKAPLRGKELSTRREMVVQYISATAKSENVAEKEALSHSIGYIYSADRHPPTVKQGAQLQ